MKYLHQKTPNGVYYFRKRVPKDIVDVIGKSIHFETLKTHNPLKAQVNAKIVELKVKAEWDQARADKESTQQGSFKEAQELLNRFDVGILVDGLGDFGQERFLDFLMDKQPQSLLKEHEGSLSTLDDPEATLSGTENKALQIMDGTVSLSDAIEYYIEISGKSDERKFKNSANRSLEFFTDVLGDRPINQYRRREIGDRLLDGVRVDGLKTATVSRRLSDVKSAVNKVILNFEYQFKNPFEKHVIPNLRDDEESRTSLSDKQHDDLMLLFTKDDTGDTMNGLKMLFDTGMRVSECFGLRTEDVYLDSDIPHITLHRNTFRRLKTKQSQRLIPLVGYALEAARNQVANNADSEWLFPRYIDTKKGDVRNDNASAALNKRLQRLGFTCHYFRHNMKDRLKLADVNGDDVNDLQGWSRKGQAGNYGEMTILKLLHKNMKKVEVKP